MSTYQAGQEIFVMQHRQSLKAVSFGSTLTCIFILTYVILTKLIIYLYPAQRVILYNIWMIILPYLGIGAFTGFLSGIVNTAVYLRLFEKINTPYFSEEMLELLAPQVKKEP